jgi:D-glycero-D-manno-heptose 1,7-bisphosphate phosphatase
VTGDARVGADGLWREVPAVPGAARGRPALFLDRDGIVVEDVGYLHRRGDVRLIDGIAGLIRRAHDAGAAVVVVTNQSGIGRGLYGWADLAAVQDEIVTRLMAEGAAFDAVFACPFHAEALEPYRHPDHPARKPNPGMLLMAGEALGLDLARSWIVGDRARDIGAGRLAGLAGGLLLGHGVADEEARQTSAMADQGFAVALIDRLDEVDRHIAWLA